MQNTFTKPHHHHPFVGMPVKLRKGKIHVYLCLCLPTGSGSFMQLLGCSGIFSAEAHGICAFLQQTLWGT